jgi:hypothetical protein
LTSWVTIASRLVILRRPPKGQSGNPRGRSLGAKNLKTLLSDLNEFVIVSENGPREGGEIDERVHAFLDAGSPASGRIYGSTPPTAAA